MELKDTIAFPRPISKYFLDTKVSMFGTDKMHELCLLRWLNVFVLRFHMRFIVSSRRFLLNSFSATIIQRI